MLESENRFDRFFEWVVTRASGRVIVAVALVFYPVLGLVVPTVLGWSTPNLVGINLVGVSVAALLIIGWLAARVEASRRRHLVEWTSDLRMLNAEEFEWFVGEIFRRDGWAVREVGHQGRADGNADLVLSRGAKRRLVQCKRWQSWQVGVDDIRGFAGALLREKLQGADGVFVTMSDFTESAIAEAAQSGMQLVNGRELYRLAEAARRPVPCPECGSSMILGRSPHGWWFRCVATGCAGKRDLDRDPARAVDLLTAVPPRRMAADQLRGRVADA